MNVCKDQFSGIGLNNLFNAEIWFVDLDTWAPDTDLCSSTACDWLGLSLVTITQLLRTFRAFLAPEQFWAQDRQAQAFNFGGFFYNFSISRGVDMIVIEYQK